jgi:dTDP-4-amino-4,6-dideoxygalactose transaminase
MSRLSESIASGVDPSEVVKRRRENFNSLDYVLQGTPEYRPAWNPLPAGTCPLFLPVWVENREDVMARMMSNGVETFRFGASSSHELDAREFPESSTLRDKILCLPIHQDLEYSDIERIGTTFRKALNATQEVAAASAV